MRLFLLKWTTPNKSPRQRWWSRPNTSSRTQMTLTAWTKTSTKSTRTTRRTTNTRATPLRSCAREARVLSRLGLHLCPSQPPQRSTAIRSPLCPTPTSARSRLSGGRARIIVPSLQQTSERSPWMKTLWLCCLQNRPASCLIPTLLVCSLLVGSLPSGSPPRHGCVTHPRGENSPLEVGPLPDGIPPRWGPARPASRPFSTSPRPRSNDPCLLERSWPGSGSLRSEAGRGSCWGQSHHAEALTNTKAAVIKPDTRRRWRWLNNKQPLKWKWYVSPRSTVPLPNWNLVTKTC